MKGKYSLDDIISKVEESEVIKVATKDVLTSVLEELKYTRLFGGSDYPDMDSLARQGGISIIDVSDTTNMIKGRYLNHRCI